MEVSEKTFKGKKITYKIALPEEYSKSEKDEIYKRIFRYYNVPDKEAISYLNEIVGVCFVDDRPIVVCVYSNYSLNEKMYYANSTFSHKSYVSFNTYLWSFVHKCDQFVEENNEKIRNLHGLVHHFVNEKWLKFCISQRGKRFWEKNGYNLLINNKDSAIVFRNFKRRK